MAIFYNILEMNIVFLVDTSASMAGRKIEQLNEFMEEAVELTEKIALEKEVSIRMRVIEFNSEAKWLFGDANKGIEHIDWTPLHSSKNCHTDIAQAINLARSIMYRRFLGEPNYCPFVVFVSDGLSDDSQGTIEAIENLKHALYGKVTRIAVCVEGANEEELVSFASKGIIERDDGSVCYDHPIVIGANEHRLYRRLLQSHIHRMEPQEDEPIITVTDDWIE